MPINWPKFNMRKLKHRKAKYQDHCGAGKLPCDEARHYEIALPEEALMMSRQGRAKGYDVQWWGDKEPSGSPPIVEITEDGVQFMLENDAQKRWLKEVEGDQVKFAARKEMIRRWNWTSWKDLFPINREFLLSLLWIPVDPYTEMEILARAAL